MDVTAAHLSLPSCGTQSAYIHCSGAVTGVLMHMQKVNRKVTALIDM